MTITSVKLGEATRDKIRAALLENKKYGDEFDPLYKESAKLAMDCYERKYDKATRAKIKSLPEGWLNAVDKISVKFGSYSHIEGMHFNGLSRFLRWSNKKDKFPEIKMRMPQFELYKSPSLTLERDDELTKRFIACKSSNDALEEKHEKVVREIDSVLNSVSTTGRLIQVWPEIEPIVRKIVAVPFADIKNLPAKVMTDLNSELGLKPVKAT